MLHVPLGRRYPWGMLRLLGIDPGLRLTGYGVVALPVGALEPRLEDAGVFRLDAKQSLADRLLQLDDDLSALIDEAKPGLVVVEQIFAHYKHPRTAVLMAHARGVILLAARRRGVEVVDLPSTEVKKAMTGYGHASKDQMQRAVQSQYRLKEIPSPPDVADAIAIATAHARRIAVDRLAGPA